MTDKCCFCGKEVDYYFDGNDPRPIQIRDRRDPVCCNECNAKIVVPTRKYVCSDAYTKEINDRVLYDVLSILYFQDYNKQCNYDNMTGAEVVEAQHKVLQEIEDRYNYHLRDDIF